MFELYLILYLAAVALSVYATLKRHRLLGVPLQEKVKLVEAVMQKLHGLKCPLCGVGSCFVEAVNFAESSVALLECEGCRQKTLWKLEGNLWKMVAPYRLPLQPSTQIKVNREKGEEEIKLVFG